MPLALALCLLVGCEIETTAIPRTAPHVVVHGVLSASASSQVVLLERSRSGSVTLFAPPFDVGDPVLSDEGIAEGGATVELTTPSGQKLAAREDITVTDKGSGVYRFTLAGSALDRSGPYRLMVRTTKGEVLTAETSVPSGSAALSATYRKFDRSSDTALLQWPAVPSARSYLVRIETPFGPRSFFTDSTRLRLTGELRNVEVSSLPRVFIPGYRQAVTISAVDSNYYDYFRTHNDAVSGAGLISRIQGGLGVFGALVRVGFYDFDVVVPQPEPIAGTFQWNGAGKTISMTIYVESRAAKSDQADAVSGWHQPNAFRGPGGMVGTVRNGRFVLALLNSQLARDTLDVFEGEVRGDTLVGQYRIDRGVQRLVRQP